MKFCVYTLGCKVNQYESQSIENILIARGHTLAKAGEGCDVCIVNTCAVTGESARKSRQAVRRLKKLEPGALVVVCGCLSELDPESATALGADLIGGSGDKEAFAIEIEKRSLNSKLDLNSEFEIRNSKLIDAADAVDVASAVDAVDVADVVDAVDAIDVVDAADAVDAVNVADASDTADVHNSEFRIPNSEFNSRTRALLKIQDGCDNFCAYCIIPYARGRSRSLPIHQVIDKARNLEATGYREIVIIGIEISSYGKDLPETPPLMMAIKEISKAAPNTRIRLGSLDPSVLTNEFCNSLSEISNLCEHFHISLQSGCDETLLRMRRKYDTNAVYAAVARLRGLFPNCGITGDLITGFPGETESEFMQTMDFIKSLAFSDMHIFPFSPREGTLAASMPNQVLKSIRHERAKAATSAANEMAMTFLENQVGTTANVLFERKRNGYWTGYSENYIEVSTPGDWERNEVYPVLITKIEEGRAIGKVALK